MDKLNQVCYNARHTGMLNDPRTTFDTNPNSFCREYSPKRKNPSEPRVCGNCRWYSVQGDPAEGIELRR